MPDLSKQLLESEFVCRLGGFLVSTLMSRWMMTLDYRVAYYDPSVDVGRVEYRQPVIYLIWHEYMTLPYFVRRNTKLALVVSRHRDAEILTQASELSGFKCFRGSSGRGGSEVIREILADKDLKGMVITPDGPRGPRRQIAAGPIFLASKLQFPIVLIGGGLQRPHRNRRAWDHFAVPRLHSRARMIFSPPIYLPKKVGRGRLEPIRQSLENSLANITAAAEAWADSGDPHHNSTFFYPGPFNCDSAIRHQR